MDKVVEFPWGIVTFKEYLPFTGSGIKYRITDVQTFPWIKATITGPDTVHLGMNRDNYGV